MGRRTIKNGSFVKPPKSDADPVFLLVVSGCRFGRIPFLQFTLENPSRRLLVTYNCNDPKLDGNRKYTKHIQKHSKKVNSYAWLSRQKRSTKHSIRGTFCKVCCGTSSPPFQRLNLGCKNSEILWCGDVVLDTYNNEGKTKINNPPVITINRWYGYHSQMGGFVALFYLQ